MLRTFVSLTSRTAFVGLVAASDALYIQPHGRREPSAAEQ